ncbi:MAG: tRNA guanosine(34) transglycosylase Tgt, partial [Patescibacteria group bacterium]
MFKFKIEKKGSGLSRAGVIETSHGIIETPAFIPVATKATVKSLTPEMVGSLGAQAVLANTYHLYLEPGDKLVKKAGGLGKFMNWQKPTFTDSGGFQVFSLGRRGTNKFGQKGAQQQGSPLKPAKGDPCCPCLAQIDEDGVIFRSHLDGSEHRFTPEKSIEIQHNLGADIIFAFDECPPGDSDYAYQTQAMNRTHAWAERSLKWHQELLARTLLKGAQGESLPAPPALFGIVQGGRFDDLREESAKFLTNPPAGGDFDGFGIGGTFDKRDIELTIAKVNKILPEDKPRHLLGIGEPEDFAAGVLAGCDTFDCVLSTRLARHGTLQTALGKMNILNAQYREDFSP